MVAGMTRMQKCRYLPPHAAPLGKSAPGCRLRSAPLRVPGWGKGACLGLPTAHEGIRNKTKVIAGDTQRAEALGTGERCSRRDR